MKETERRVEHKTSTAIFVAQLERYGRTTRALGDAIGDRLRAEVTRRVHGVFPAEASIARTGSDEFAVVVSDVTATEAREGAARLRDALRQAVEIPGGSIHYVVAVGVLLTDEPSAELSETIVRRARRAIRAARASGEGVHVLDASEDG